jgi:predicted MFS family arabinose efflux permease
MALIIISFHFRLASKKVYVALFGLSGFIQYSIGGYMGGTLSTIEKDFKISSTNIGVILAGFDIFAMFTAIFLCYYASKMHRTRVMAFGKST